MISQVKQFCQASYLVLYIYACVTVRPRAMYSSSFWWQSKFICGQSLEMFLTQYRNLEYLSKFYIVVCGCVMVRRTFLLFLVEVNTILGHKRPKAKFLKNYPRSRVQYEPVFPLRSYSLGQNTQYQKIWLTRNFSFVERYTHPLWE